MNFKIEHNNFNVLDLDRSLKFYSEALGLEPVSSHEAADGSFKLVFIGNANSAHTVELTWLRDRTEPYDLGDNEIHLALRTDDFDAAFAKHTAMGCVCFENKAMGLYFIEDPDGYWIEILPPKQ